MKDRRLSKPAKGSKEFTNELCQVIRAIWMSLLVLPFSVSAVLFIHTDDPNHNTTAPMNPAAAQAWDLQGRWRCCLGTPIAPRWFISAKHIGGEIGDPFILKGKQYITIAKMPDPKSDLILWGITGTFSEPAAIYPRKDELEKRMLVFGRGAARGEPVMVQEEDHTIVKGWKSGSRHRLKRWGENVISGIEEDLPDVPTDQAELLRADFDFDGLTNEAGLSGGDSGGGMFLLDGSEWKLAAVSYAAGGTYNPIDEGKGFFAMLFDQGGLFRFTIDNRKEFWDLVVDEPEDIPGSIWGTRIQHRLNWINQTMDQMPDPTQSIVLESSPTPDGTFTETKNWVLVEEPLALKISIPKQSRFFRIKATGNVNLSVPQQIGNELLLPFSGR